MTAREQQVAAAQRVVLLDQAHELVETAPGHVVAPGEDEAARLVHRLRAGSGVAQRGDLGGHAHAGRLPGTDAGTAIVSPTRWR